MNKFVKIIYLSLFVLCLCLITSCGVKNIDIMETKVYEAGSVSDLCVKDFKEDFMNSQLDDNSFTDCEIVNVVSEEVYNETNIGIFILKSTNYQLFIWNNGEISRIDTFGYKLENRKIEFTNFAVGDLNKDGYKEFYFAYCYGEIEPSERGRISFAYSYCLDLKSGKLVESMTNYEGYLFFKVDNTNLYVVECENNVLSDDYKVFFKVTPNTKKFEILKDNFTVSTDLFTANVYIENDFVDFPVFMGEFCSLYFNVRVEMTYLGETFTYVNSNTYLDGAVASFNFDGNTINQEAIVAGDAITTFTVVTNQVIDRDYQFYDSENQPIKRGTYDVTISYKGSSATVEDVIKFY